MLVLSRKRNEAVTLVTAGGERITVYVSRTGENGGAVRLAFDAPRSVQISRGELPPAEAHAVRESIKRLFV